ncbi:MAG: FMN-binding protein [Bacillota bacterium]
MNRKIRKILSVLFVVLIIVAIGFFYLSRGLNEGQNMTVDPIPENALEDLSDGSYRGQHEFRRWTNEVEIVVEDNEIVEINVIEDVSIAQDDVREEIFARVKNNQTTDVDVISGSTVTSKAYLQAITRAINLAVAEQ